ncbi:hypothetical protein QBC47DRAFT_97977 [Echria macrotheca]|uniref:Chromatin modification-related protein n=1 Tax=Echria macrotheca TaxID=438768 RepID=A0AAJ0BLG7_9PEZI|nr:hypothetical protein QBC47DRAFT_97977 [Echria macrotheca]
MSDTGVSALEGDEQLETKNLRLADLKTNSRPTAGAKIFVWQLQTEQSSDCLEPADRSLVARLCADVLDLLHEVARRAPKCDSVPKSVSVGLERVRGLITLWSDGYGIKDGNLDHVFTKSRSIRRSTLKVLSSIANTLVNRLIPLSDIESDRLNELAIKLTATNAETSYAIHSNDQGSDSDSSSDASYDVREDNLKEVLEDLKVDAQCLMDLDPLFKNPALDLSLTKQKAAETIEWAPEKAYCEKVQQRFPQASISLVHRLGKANWDRYLRLQYQRNTTHEPSESAPQDVDTGTVAGSKFHDSGMGTSLPTASSYAETVMTYTAGTDGEKIRIPQLPEDAKRGESFECIACARLIRATTTTSWKSHLMSDLKPYICLEEDCNQFGFDTREDWVSHLHLDHSYSYVADMVACPLCCEQLRHFSYIFHLGRHLEEISLSALPANANEDDGGDNAVVDSESLIFSDDDLPPPSSSDEGEGDDKKYCLCRNVSYGDMILCENDDCPYEWFHWGCVGLGAEPIGSWYCPSCTDAMRKKAKKETGTAPPGGVVSTQPAAQTLESQYQGQPMPSAVSNSNSGNKGDEVDADVLVRWYQYRPQSPTGGELENLENGFAALQKTIATAAKTSPEYIEAKKKIEIMDLEGVWGGKMQDRKQIQQPPQQLQQQKEMEFNQRHQHPQQMQHRSAENETEVSAQEHNDRSEGRVLRPRFPLPTTSKPGASEADVEAPAPGRRRAKADAAPKNAETQHRLPCSECRRRKRKCDGGQPCSNCKHRRPQPLCEYKPLAKLPVASRRRKLQDESWQYN